jgi:cob(I)alamin adenosyltransferase
MTERIYTRTGDAGATGLFGGGRVPKSHPRVEAYGEVDELNACIGLAIIAVRDATLRDRLRMLQADLFAIGAHLATQAPEGAKSRSHLPDLPTGRAEDIEGWIDEMEAGLEPLRAFILPGGSESAARLHLCRTVCRRAERRVVALAAAANVEPAVLVLLNRLSDFLFVATRTENAEAGYEDTRWDPSGRAGG